jgi:hypothetical protein
MLEKAEHMTTPSPNIHYVENPWTGFLLEEQTYTYIGLNIDVNQSQY